MRMRGGGSIEQKNFDVTGHRYSGSCGLLLRLAARSRASLSHCWQARAIVSVVSGLWFFRPVAGIPPPAGGTGPARLACRADPICHAPRTNTRPSMADRAKRVNTLDNGRASDPNRAPLGAGRSWLGEQRNRS